MRARWIVPFEIRKIPARSHLLVLAGPCCTLLVIEREHIHPLALARLDESAALFERDVQKVREQMRPGYEALLQMSEEDREWGLIELHTQEDLLLLPAKDAWMLREQRIIASLIRQGLG